MTRARLLATPSPKTGTVQPRVLQRTCTCAATTCETCKSEGRLQRYALGTALPIAPDIVHDVLRSPGEPLEPSLRASVGRQLGCDFSRVRIHTDARAARSADAVAARAYTVGEHVVFGAGQYRPGAPAGRELLTHELVHVRQQSSLPLGDGDLVVGEPDTAAEHEARAEAHELTAPGSAGSHAPAGGPRVLQRDAQAGGIGAGIGAGVGAAIGALGFLLGPIGGLVGMLVGAVAGAVVGGLAAGLTVKREDRGEKEKAMVAVHRLLSSTFWHPMVTEDDAHRALAILITLSPAARLRAFNELYSTGEWMKLVKKLPEADGTAQQEFLGSISREAGPVMAGDQFTIEFWNTDGKIEHVSKTPAVADDGFHAADLPKDLPAYVVGLPLAEAREAIAAAYSDSQTVDHAQVWIKLLKRGDAYGMWGGPVEDTGRWLDITPSNEATQKLRKDAEFRKFLDGQGDKVRPEVAEGYKAELAAHPDRYATPQHLLNFVNAITPPPPPPAPDPETEWHAVSAAILRSQHAGGGTLDAMYLDAYVRFQRKFEQHRAKGDLASSDPWAAYGQALHEAGVANQAQWRADYMRKLTEKRADEEADKAVDKVMATYDFVLKNIVMSPMPPVTYAADKERGVGYLSWRNPLENKLRQQMASDIMAYARTHMNDPGFAKGSPVVLVSDWMALHPAQAVILQYAMSRPDTEIMAIPIEIPALHTAVEIVVGLIPVVGQIVGIYEVISGEDLFGHKLGAVERGVIAIAILLPAAAKAFKIGRGALTASRLISEFGPMTEREAAAVYKALIPLEPGSWGARLLGETAEKVRAGEKISQAEAKELETLLGAMGLADKAEAKALTKAAGTAAEADARIAGAIDRNIGKLGAITDETKELLRKDPALVESLLGHAAADRVLKSCHSVCYPPGLIPAQVEEIDRELTRLAATGTVNEKAVEAFLHANRGDLNRAIAQLINAADATALNAKLPFLTAKGLAAMDASAQAAKAMAAKVSASEARGVMHGRAQALADNLVDVKFKNPFEHIGKYGQGFDEIMATSANLNDKSTIIYIIDYKGGTATLAGDQLTHAWVVRNIQRLYRSGGSDGRQWAETLSKALSEGRLRGRTYSTKTAISGTVTEELGTYKKTIVPLTE